MSFGSGRRTSYARAREPRPARFDQTRRGNGHQAMSHPFSASSRTYRVTDQHEPGTAGTWRVFRGLVVGTGATLLAVGGHRVAGDEPPAWTTVVCLALLVGTVSVWLSRVRWTFPRLLLLLVAAQTAMHTAFVTTSPVTADGALQGHHAGHPAGHDIAVQTQVTSHAENLLPGGAMLAGHLLAAVVTALLLWRGEQWLATVLDALTLRACRVLGSTTLLHGAGPRLVPVRAVNLPMRRTETGTWSQRGPPCE
jgi:hypothetical protein